MKKIKVGSLLGKLFIKWKPLSPKMGGGVVCTFYFREIFLFYYYIIEFVLGLQLCLHKVMKYLTLYITK